MRHILIITNMPKWCDKWEQLFVAATFAQAGELKQARCLLKPERIILLVIRKQEIKQEVLDYVLSLCQRIQAGLEIFSRRETLSIENFLERLYQAEIYHRTITYQEPLEETVIAYANAHSCIAFVVVDSLEQGEQENFWNKLTCPLVVANLVNESL